MDFSIRVTHIFFGKTMYASVLLMVLLSCSGQRKMAKPYAGKNWTAFAGDDSKSRYSTLSQVNKQNAKDLRLQWTYRSGDFSQERGTPIQCNPVVVDGIMYGTTPGLKLVALDGTSGKEAWRFDPFTLPLMQDLRSKEGINIVPGTNYWVNRGVTWSWAPL